MRNQRSPLSLQDRYDNLQIYCQEMREHVQELEYELSQAHNELLLAAGEIDQSAPSYISQSQPI